MFNTESIDLHGVLSAGIVPKKLFQLAWDRGGGDKDVLVTSKIEEGVLIISDMNRHLSIDGVGNLYMSYTRIGGDYKVKNQRLIHHIIDDTHGYLKSLRDVVI